MHLQDVSVAIRWRHARTQPQWILQRPPHAPMRPIFNRTSLTNVYNEIRIQTTQQALGSDPQPPRLDPLPRSRHGWSPSTLSPMHRGSAPTSNPRVYQWHGQSACDLRMRLCYFLSTGFKAVWPSTLSCPPGPQPPVCAHLLNAFQCVVQSAWKFLPRALARWCGQGTQEREEAGLRPPEPPVSNNKRRMIRISRNHKSQ